MAIERIVRPFQTGDVTPPRLTTGNGQTKSIDVVRIIIGKQNKGTVLQKSESSSTTFYMKHKQKEEPNA